jgi:hypothetical protein
VVLNLKVIEDNKGYFLPTLLQYPVGINCNIFDSVSGSYCS